jgi:hypothetical protein
MIGRCLPRGGNFLVRLENRGAPHRSRAPGHPRSSLRLSVLWCGRLGHLRPSQGLKKLKIYQITCKKLKFSGSNNNMLSSSSKSYDDDDDDDAMCNTIWSLWRSFCNKYAIFQIFNFLSPWDGLRWPKRPHQSTESRKELLGCPGARDPRGALWILFPRGIFPLRARYLPILPY